MTAPELSVTIIVPCFNAGTRLGGFLSRLDATLATGAVAVIVDDASSDGTAEDLARWAATRSGVTLLRHDVNAGPAAARNSALTLVETDFVWFVDVDDEWDLRIVAVLSEAARWSSADVVVCRALYRAREATSGRVIDGLDRTELVSSQVALERMASGEMQGFLWNKLFSYRVLERDHFPALSSQSDFIGVLHAVEKSDQVLFIPDLLYSYLFTASSVSRRRNPDLGNLLVCAEEMRAALRRNRGKMPLRLDDWFTTWFYALPVALLPIRHDADPSRIREGIGLGSAALRRVDLIRSARQPRVLVLALVLKHAPVVFALLSRALLTLHDTHRRLTIRRKALS